MPELPEVETTVRDLRPQLVGRTIKRAAVTWERTIASPAAAAFSHDIVGFTITGITRRGKYLVFSLERPQTPIERRLREQSAEYVAVPAAAGTIADITGKFLIVHLR